MWSGGAWHICYKRSLHARSCIWIGRRASSNAPQSPSLVDIKAFDVANTWNCALDRLQHRQDRYIALHNRLVLPRPSSFVASGQSFNLPLDISAVFGNPQEPTQQELEYLAGFFDGDGCVASDKNLSPPKLLVGQSIDHPDVLLQFARHFGGSEHLINKSTPPSKTLFVQPNH